MRKLILLTAILFLFVSGVCEAANIIRFGAMPAKDSVDSSHVKANSISGGDLVNPLRYTGRLAIRGAVSAVDTLQTWQASLGNTVGVIDTSGTFTQWLTTGDGAYSNSILSEWTPTENMTSYGSNGIYAISNAVKNLNNAYVLRGRMDLRDAVGSIAVNQLHGVDALVNLNETQDYDVEDNISVFGGAIHGGASGDVTAGSGDGTLNLFYGVWGPTAEQEYTAETNGILLVTHAATNVDYGVQVQNSADMDAGVYLNNHTSNSPATMDVGIEMVSAASKMASGIDMSAASFTTADIILQNSETIDNNTNGRVYVDADTLRTKDNFIANGLIMSTIGGSIPTWGHTPTGGAFEGSVEVDGNLYVDAQLLLYTNGLEAQDDVPIAIGTSTNMRFVWNQNSTNDDIAVMRFLESDGTDIPILVVSDISWAPNGDSKFDDITEPAIGFVDDDADSYFRIGFITDDAPGIVTDGDPFSFNNVITPNKGIIQGYSHVGGSRNTTDADYIIGVSSDDGAITITLDTDNVIAGRTFIIKDEDGNAASNNITIATEASETIDGGATYTVSTNYTSISLYSDGTNWFIH